MTLTPDSARQIIHSQPGIPLGIRRSAWLLYRIEVQKVNPRTQKLYTPRRALRNVLGWMEEQRMHQDMRRLTPRELEIVRLIIEGLTQKEIALRFDCSLDNVKDHLRRVRRKVGGSMYRVVAVAVEYGWVPPPRLDR